MTWHPSIDHSECEHDRNDDVEMAACEISAAFDWIDAASPATARVIQSTGRLTLTSEPGLSGALKSAGFTLGDRVAILPLSVLEELRAAIAAWAVIDGRSE